MGSVESGGLRTGGKKLKADEISSAEATGQAPS